MTDYTKTTDFTPKDSLTPGDPAKKVKGSELDTEFDALEAAVATKYDSADLGSVLQAYDADLTAIAALVSAADKIPYATGAGTWALTTFTSAARNLLDDATAGDMRTTLGLGSLATASTISNADWSGTDLAVANGGTGSSTAADARTALGLAIGTDVQAYDADTAKIDVAQNWSKAQRATPVTLTDGANIAVDASLGNIYRVTLGGNRTLDNPTNLVDGWQATFYIKQDGTGSRTLAYGTKYEFPGDAAPTLTTTAGKMDIITATYDSSADKLYCNISKNYSTT